MTQIQHETADQPAEAGARDFAAWLTSKRLTLSALVFAAAQVGLNSYVLNRGYFQNDDFVIGGLAAHSFSTRLPTQACALAAGLMPTPIASRRSTSDRPRQDSR